MRPLILRTLIVLMFPYTAFAEPLALEEAVRLAAAQSPEVRRAAAGLQAAQARVSALVPSLGAVLTVTGTGASGPPGVSGEVRGNGSVQSDTFAVSLEASPDVSTILSIDASWNLWPLKVPEDESAFASALADRDAALGRLSQARVVAGLKARHAYLTLQIAVRRTALAHGAAAAAKERLERAVRASPGVSRAELLLLRRDEAAARLSLQESDDVESVGRKTLERQVGVGEIALEPSAGLDYTAPAIDEAALKDLAQRTSPSLLAARRGLVLAERRQKSAQNSSPLSVQLLAGMELSRQTSSPTFSLGLRGTFDLLGGNAQSGLENADSEVVSARLTLESAQNSLLENLARQIDAVEKAALEVEALQYGRDHARVVYLEAQSKLSAGAVTADDLAVARRDFERGQLDLDAAVVDYRYFQECLMSLPGEEL